MKQSEALTALRGMVQQLAPIVGDRLPAERALAARMGCSRQTLRNALTVLEAEGEIWRHVGQGTFRGPRPSGLPVRDHLLVEFTGPADLMEARLWLEPEVAAAAARSAAPQDLVYLRDRVAAGRKARDRRDSEEADSLFHRAIAEVAGNPVLIGVLAYLADARRRAAWQREWDRTYQRMGVDEFRSVHSDQHEKIVDAIEARDEEGARTAMRSHLSTVRRAMLGSESTGQREDRIV